ncbi:hypothetical protein [Shewanella sp. 10N.286.52.B9]|uniref:hypothetical protein n=1 Tax=Shewanella sp. 10N.286.52.B9 TaxID=1880837 RepID=UPI000C863CF6|nr:hypothetical protein [Shewanella sp. 10N.286.52.B9]PMG48061.1 hypothetical protein BCU91_02960 [Shewanella sp. 10N.286.52.B9]
MPWLIKRLQKYNKTESLLVQLGDKSKAEMSANLIVWPLSYKTWALIFFCLIGIPSGLIYFNTTEYFGEITLTAVVLILIKHLVSHFKMGLKVKITKDAIELPDELVTKSASYFQMSRVDTIHIQRFFYHHHYKKKDAIVKSVMKAEIMTHARLILNTGEKINLSRVNCIALPELVEYIVAHHSPKIRYYYPMPLKFLGVLFLLYIGFLTLFGIYGYPSYL